MQVADDRVRSLFDELHDLVTTADVTTVDATTADVTTDDVTTVDATTAAHG